ncbi:MAG: hypothetical protein ACOWWH_10605 [Eubacteriaceae bacterium]
MNKKIDKRLPRETGKDVMPEHAAIKTPWEKLVSYHDAAHYANRYNAVISAAMLQALRILVPDYVERVKAMCKNAYDRVKTPFLTPYGEMMKDDLNTHPFFRGNFVGAQVGDFGDECLLMCGRVNDFGTYRVEKELDTCPWDILGSEMGRATTQSLLGSADGLATWLPSGPKLDYHMVEAKCCGDLHCRVVAESRDKFPMPPHEQWECYGPIATDDQIKFTPEEDCMKEPMVFQEDCNYKYVNGTCMESDSKSLYPMTYQSNGTCYITPTINDLINDGTVDEKFADHVIKCVCEAAGKAAFGEFYSKEGLRSWLGVPRDIDDGRVMGAHIEMYLQSMIADYTVEAFNADEVIYVIDRTNLSFAGPRYIDALISTWYGMTKTLVNAQWALWEEAGETSEDQLRIKIAKKVDKLC